MVWYVLFINNNINIIKSNLYTNWCDKLCILFLLVFFAPLMKLAITCGISASGLVVVKIFYMSAFYLNSATFLLALVKLVISFHNISSFSPGMKKQSICIKSSHFSKNVCDIRYTDLIVKVLPGIRYLNIMPNIYKAI